MMNNIYWVFLRGLSREHQHWGKFPSIFKQYFPQAIILTPDLPGNGIHHQTKSPTTIAEILEFVRNDIPIQSIQQPVNILALSMGAMLAVEWMKRYPHECHSGVLINTSIKGINPFKHRLRPENYGRIIKDILLYRNVMVTEQCILQLTSNHNHQPTIIDDWISYAQNHPVSRLNIIRQLIAASQYIAPEQKPEQPLLLLRSLQDHLVNAQSSQAISQHWGVPLMTHPEAGHDLPLDDPHWVCKNIKIWLDKQTAA
ncbi:MAG: alpha/beta fold hydrolase [Gammaproteobacteria bacterium]